MKLSVHCRAIFCKDDDRKILFFQPQLAMERSFYIIYASEKLKYFVDLLRASNQKKQNLVSL